MWTAGYTGSGQVIAVLDTGVDRMHPFLSGKVVEEACYSGNANCPNGLTTQTGVGSGVHCTYAVSGCKHGTHVAGIAAGQGSSFSGVTKGANVMSVQVFSVSSLLSSLQSTGTPVTDTRVAGGYTKPRINIADAAGIQDPANDAFANAQSISGASAAVNGTNVGATRESGEPDHLPATSESLGENTVWYNWTAPFSGQVTMDTCTSGST